MSLYAIVLNVLGNDDRKYKFSDDFFKKIKI